MKDESDIMDMLFATVCESESMVFSGESDHSKMLETRIIILVEILDHIPKDLSERIDVIIPWLL